MRIYRQIKNAVFKIIQPAENGNVASRIFDLAIMALIFASIASVFITTFDISPELTRVLSQFEKWAIIVFSIEYLLRIWTAELLFPELPPWRAKLRYMRSGMAIVDLVSILPFYLPMFLPIDLVGIRAIRLVRLLRVFKMNRYTDAMSSIAAVFRNKFREMLVSVFLVLIMLTIDSLLIYYAEHDAQPDKFANAFSGVWWAVATLTTVGYGDIYPVTAMGRFLGGIIALTGIGLVAVPTGIISAGFVDLLEKRGKTEPDEKPDEKPNYCPHCGKKL